MERKAFHALLLSLAVIAGAMTITTDAHAQTNTERLMTVEDNTNSIIAALSDIADAITTGFAEVMAALGALSSDVADTQAAVSGIDDKIDAVNTAIAGAAAALAQPDPAVAAIADEVSTIHEEVESIADEVSTIHEEVESINVAEITEGVTTNNVAIRELADRLTEVTSMLEMVADSVGVVQETVATSADGTTTALSELHAVEVEYGVPVSAFGNNEATDTTYKADLQLTCESPVFIDRVDTQYTGTAPTASDTVGVFAPHTTLDTDKVSVVANSMPVYDTQFEAGGDPILYRNGASFNLAEMAAGSSLTIKLSTDRETAIIAETVNKTFSLKTYVETNARDRIETDTVGVAADPVPAGGTNLTKATAGKVTVLDLTVELYSSAEDPKCTVTPPAGPSVDYTQTDQVVSFAINAPDTETRSIKTITPATFSCSGATAITQVSVEGGLIADFRTFVDLTLTADTTTPLAFEKVGDVLEVTLEEPIEITSGTVTLAGKIPGSAALVSVTYDTVANAKCSVPTSP